MNVFTRDQIEAIKVGSVLRRGFGDGYHYGEPKEVVEITTKREDISGKLFVHGYHVFSDNSRMSFSIKEGSELDFKLYEVVRY